MEGEADTKASSFAGNKKLKGMIFQPDDEN